jgi:hypothetical protein
MLWARACSLDAEAIHDTYKGRIVVERSFVRLKQWRALATRYDKLAIVYRAAAVLAAVIIWLRHIGDTLGAPAAAVHAAEPGCTGARPPRRLRLRAVDRVDLVVPPGGVADGAPLRADPSAGALGSSPECAHAQTVVLVALTGMARGRVS